MIATRAREARGSRCTRGGAFLAVLVAGLLVPARSPANYALDLPEALAAAARVDDARCLDCHEDHVPHGGIHADLRTFPTAGVRPGCQSCHGPGSVHVDSSEPGDIVNPATSDPTLSIRLCLQCHRTGEMDGFEGGVHAASDVTCASCHESHGEQRALLLQETEPDLCYGCHQDVRSSAWLPSRHPIREGRMSCSDCHDPHSGDLQTLQPGDRTNDLCLGCHSRYQGPYIFEHSPVVEDCLICHAPHGSVANNLLTQNEPFLCLQCHQMHFHTTIPGIEGEFTTLDGYGGTSTRDGSKAGFLTKCTRCHTEIHGSDLPSQSISGQGRSMTR